MIDVKVVEIWLKIRVVVVCWIGNFLAQGVQAMKLVVHVYPAVGDFLRLQGFTERVSGAVVLDA